MLRSFLQFALVGLVWINIAFAQSPNISYPTPLTFTSGTAINPLLPTNTGGAVPATTYGQVTTLAGSSQLGFNDGNGSSASFGAPYGLATDILGNVYVADNSYSLIRKISPDGTVVTLAGNGNSRLANGMGTSASFNHPFGLAADESGNLYITDYQSHVIRYLNTNRMVTTYAGTGTSGFVNGPVANAKFYLTTYIARDVSGNLFITEENRVIRKITSGGIVSTFAGSGQPGSANGPSLTASFTNLQGITIDPSGNVFVVDENSIRKISTAGIVSTFAGGAINGYIDGPTTSARFYRPKSIVSDAAGNIYVSDYSNFRIRKITPLGMVSTFAGSGMPGFADGVGTAATFQYPIGIAIDVSGNIYVCDHSTVRKIIATGYTIDKPLPAGLIFDGTTGGISGTPTASSPPTNYTITAYNGSGSSSAIINITVLEAGATQTVIFPPLAAKSICAADFMAAATSSNATIPITYTSSNPSVATVSSNGTIRITGSGTTIITASQPGNNIFSAATPVSQTLTVSAPLTPSVTLSPTNPNICSGQSATFTATANNAGAAPTFLWNVNGQSVSSNGSSFTSSTFINSDKVTCTVVNNDFCRPVSSVQSDEATIVVLAALTSSVNILASSTGTICAGTPVTFTATPVNTRGTLTYQWTVNGVNAGSNSDTFTTSSLSNADAVSCILTSSGSCILNPTVASNIINVVITPVHTPIITIAPNVPFPICEGTQVTFTAISNEQGLQYQWFINGSKSGTGQQTFSANFNNDDKVMCEVTPAMPCAVPVLSLPVTVEINDKPSIKFAGDITINKGDKIRIDPVTAGKISTYEWSPATGLSDASIKNPFANPLASTVYTLKVITDKGCEAKEDISIVVIDSLFAPNAFSPNGDGVNDSWNIPALQFLPLCKVIVYNRFGQAVFQSKGYGKAWDGTANGNSTPTGSYYYIIDPGNGKPKLSGLVTIIR